MRLNRGDKRENLPDSGFAWLFVLSGCGCGGVVSGEFGSLLNIVGRTTAASTSGSLPELVSFDDGEQVNKENVKTNVANKDDIVTQFSFFSLGLFLLICSLCCWVTSSSSPLKLSLVASLHLPFLFMFTSFFITNLPVSSKHLLPESFMFSFLFR